MCLSPSRHCGCWRTPRLHAFIGLDRIDAVGNWIDNNFMLKRRQKRTAEQRINVSTQDYLKTHFCAAPFEQLETAPTGLAYACCPVWLPTPIGRLDTPAHELWNSTPARNIRESMIDGSFRYCNHVHCPAISGRRLESRDSRARQGDHRALPVRRRDIAGACEAVATTNPAISPAHPAGRAPMSPIPPSRPSSISSPKRRSCRCCARRNPSSSPARAIPLAASTSAICSSG